MSSEATANEPFLEESGNGNIKDKAKETVADSKNKKGWGKITFSC